MVVSDMDKKQLLRNPDIEPIHEVIAEALGASKASYAQFVSRLDSHGIQMQWRYYTDGKAWLAKGLYQWTGVRGGQKEATVFWLSIWEGFFRVTLFIPEKNRADALLQPLQDATKEKIADAKQMGKLKFFPLTFDLCSDESFGEVYRLIVFRKMLR